MRKLVENIRFTLYSDWPFYTCVLLYLIGTWSVAQYYQLDDRFSILVYLKLALLQFVPYGILFYAIYIVFVMVKTRPKGLFSYLAIDLRSKLIRPSFLRGLLGLFVLAVFLSAMTSFKSVIPEINPFNWDPVLANFDKGLHGGYVPWELLQSILGWPIVTHVIDIVYGLWFIIMMTFVMWFLFTANSDFLRKRFIISYVLCWTINGSLLAVIFSSVGPVFYSDAYPDLVNPFNSLMSYLTLVSLEYPSLVLREKEMLWAFYQNATLRPASGISAMPSMHVSVATLIFLICLRRKQVFVKVLGGVFLVMIGLGSVHLGWHYAIDGYLALIVTLVVWKCTGFIACLERSK